MPDIPIERDLNGIGGLIFDYHFIQMIDLDLKYEGKGYTNSITDVTIIGRDVKSRF